MELQPPAESVSPRSRPRLSLFRLGTATGIAGGAMLTSAGLLAWITGIGTPLVDTLASLFRGYGAGPIRAVIGGVWGASTGFAFGVALAWLYNSLVDVE